MMGRIRDRCLRLAEDRVFGFDGRQCDFDRVYYLIGSRCRERAWVALSNAVWGRNHQEVVHLHVQARGKLAVDNPVE